MLVIGLLLVALACLIVGLVLASGIWLGASLVVSVVTGYVLWRQREKIAGEAGVHKDEAAPRSAQAKAAAEAASPDASDGSQDVWVVDGKPLFHAQDCQDLAGLDAQAIPYAQATEDGFTECTTCKPVAASAGTPQVWVVDGRPDYHAEDCRSLKNAAAQSAGDSEAIPRAQAVEDGFGPCPDCRPDAAAPAAAAPSASSGSSSSSPAAAAGPDATTVWVVDGRPRYHLADCLTIKGQDAEEIPIDQATEDGFMACSMCQPQAARVPS